MEAIISIFDPETHRYDYLTGRVLTHAECGEPMWVSVETVSAGIAGPYELRGYPFRAPDEAAALRHAESRRSFAGTHIAVALR
jgi:hypothetical protein